MAFLVLGVVHSFFFGWVGSGWFSWEAACDGFQPLAIGLALRVNLNFRNQRLHQLPPLHIVHHAVQLLKIDQHFINIVAGQFLCLNGLFFGPGRNQQRFCIFNLIIRCV